VFILPRISFVVAPVNDHLTTTTMTTMTTTTTTTTTTTVVSQSMSSEPISRL